MLAVLQLGSEDLGVSEVVECRHDDQDEFRLADSFAYLVCGERQFAHADARLACDLNRLPLEDIGDVRTELLELEQSDLVSCQRQVGSYSARAMSSPQYCYSPASHSQSLLSQALSGGHPWRAMFAGAIHLPVSRHCAATWELARIAA